MKNGTRAGIRMTPYLPAEGMERLENLAFGLIEAAGRLAGQVHPEHHELLAIAARAAERHYSEALDWQQRVPRPQGLDAGQVRIQQAMDRGEDPQVTVVSMEYLRWLHRELWCDVPAELLWAEDAGAKRREAVFPGELRSGDAHAIDHLPPTADELHGYLTKFGEIYDAKRMSKLRQVVAMGAAHHRLYWIQPFVDRCGRLTRLLSRAMLLRLGLVGNLWSLSRGIALSAWRYEELMASASKARTAGLVGRGMLSERALEDFCEYFLETALEQVRFVSQRTATPLILPRLEAWCEAEAKAKRLERGSFPVLREAWLMGSVPRARVQEICGVKERQAREIVSRLAARNVLTSESPRGALRLHCPPDVQEAWFPGLGAPEYG